jgi:hypothetical protein
MLGREFYSYLQYYSFTLFVPGLTVLLFVLYVYFRDRNKRL